MKAEDDNDEFPDHSAELGLLIGIVGICSVLLALVLGEMYGWLVN
jgi:hypothetical protein